MAFEEAREKLGILGELWAFMRVRKKWWLGPIVLMLILWHRVPGIDVVGVVRTLVLSLVAAIIGAILAAIVRDIASAGPFDATKTLGALAVAALATLVGGVAFVAMSLVLRINELPAATTVLLGIARRPRRS